MTYSSCPDADTFASAHLRSWAPVSWLNARSRLSGYPPMSTRPAKSSPEHHIPGNQPPCSGPCLAIASCAHTPSAYFQTCAPLCIQQRTDLDKRTHLHNSHKLLQLITPAHAEQVHPTLYAAASISAMYFFASSVSARFRIYSRTPVLSRSRSNTVRASRRDITRVLRRVGRNRNSSLPQ